MCANLVTQTINLKTVCSSDKDDGGGCSQMSAHATGTANVTETNGNGEDLVVKKRKTRRGKSKRRNPNPPYLKMSFQQRKQGQFNRKFRSGHGQALAPFNSNQFLMEDHGDLQELDDKLNKSDGAGTSMIHSRTRDSSFSVDSDVDFYSSPEDEEEFLTREFDHAYEDLHAERLQSMTKAELIEEYIQLESKVDLLTKRLRGKSANLQSNDDETIQKTNDENSYQQEIQKLILENDELRRENEFLRSGLSRTASSLSSTMDSESDSSTSSCKSGSSSKDTSPNASPKQHQQQQQQTSVNYAETNGFSPHQQQQPSPTSV